MRTGPPCNGKTTIGSLLSEVGFRYIEADDHISSIGRVHLNDGSWSDVDRREYISLAARAAIAAAEENPKVVVTDALTVPWMRKFMLDNLAKSDVSVGLIYVERKLSTNQILDIAQKRAAEGHALDPNALLRFRNLFIPLDPATEPHVVLENPGDNDLPRLLALSLQALNKLWN